MQKKYYIPITMIMMRELNKCMQRPMEILDLESRDKEVTTGV
jgi:hypothetical protein